MKTGLAMLMEILEGHQRNEIENAKYTPYRQRHHSLEHADSQKEHIYQTECKKGNSLY